MQNSSIKLAPRQLKTNPLDLTEEEEVEESNTLHQFYPKKNSRGEDNFDANGNYPLEIEEKELMKKKLEDKFIEIFDILRIDRNDPNSTNTPRRMAKMWVDELFTGRFNPVPTLTVFPNRKKVDELVTVRGIKVMSVCSHHWLTISGDCAIGYIPGDSVIGISKFNRIVDWFARRGQIQEEMGEQIADFIEDLMKPKALGVVIRAKHYCMIARGVSESEDKSLTVTSVMRGQLATDFNLRNEFLKLLD